jgi:hypothetical protein
MFHGVTNEMTGDCPDAAIMPATDAMYATR